MFLGSITTGVPIPECGSDASSSQVTLGLEEDFTWSLDNLTSGSPSRDTRKEWVTPAGISLRAAEEGALATMDGALCAALKEDLQSSCPPPGSRPAETQGSSITWEGPQPQKIEEGALLFSHPLQTPERITISDPHWVVEKAGVSRNTVSSWHQ